MTCHSSATDAAKPLFFYRLCSLFRLYFILSKFTSLWKTGAHAALLFPGILVILGYVYKINHRVRRSCWIFLFLYISYNFPLCLIHILHAERAFVHFSFLSRMNENFHLTRYLPKLPITMAVVLWLPSKMGIERLVTTRISPSRKTCSKAYLFTFLNSDHLWGAFRVSYKLPPSSTGH